MLGELLARLDAGDRLVVLSDHGMRAQRTAGPLSGIHDSAETAIGVLILYGPRVQSGRRISADLLDVTPTVLEMLAFRRPPTCRGEC